jgi:D-alanyl-D-alanine dipeptidase
VAVAAAVLGGALLTGSVGPAAGTPDGARAPDGFVALRDVAPAVGQDLRYATRRNFTGGVVDGYRDAECLLTRPAARALERVRRDVADDGYGLLVFDCYRPRRAVERFLRWAAGPEDPATRERYHPRVPKDRLFAAGYLAARSGHSRGSTVDLTLTRDGEPVDMGTPFDFFDPRSHPDAPGVGERQRAGRQRLREAMTGRGFVPVETEWWHFTYREEPYPDTYFDFPVDRDTVRGEAAGFATAAPGATPVGPGRPLSPLLTRRPGRRLQVTQALSPVRDIHRGPSPGPRGSTASRAAAGPETNRAIS